MDVSLGDARARVRVRARMYARTTKPSRTVSTVRNMSVVLRKHCTRVIIVCVCHLARGKDIRVHRSSIACAECFSAAISYKGGGGDDDDDDDDGNCTSARDVGCGWVAE